MIDEYSIKARIYPMVIVLSPAAVILAEYLLHLEKISSILMSFGVTALLSYLLSQLGRDSGKPKEKELWDSWGGPPTTQVLRHSNDVIDVMTKSRYHKLLQEACPSNHSMSRDTENQDSKVADSVYEGWVRYLITHTRDANQFPLLFKENIGYGFRRNLWGMKSVGMSITLLSLFFTYAFYYREFKTLDPTKFSADYWILTLLLFSLLLFWLTTVTREWVRIPAFAYATRLCEAIDQLKDNH